MNNKEFLIIYSLKVDGYWALIFIDLSTNKIYYNDIFLEKFKFSTTYFYRIWGYDGLTDCIYYKNEYNYIGGFLDLHWSCLYTYIIVEYKKLLSDYKYWLNLIVSLSLFVLIFFCFYNSTSFSPNELYFILFPFRWFLFFQFIFIVLAYFIYSYDTLKVGEWVYHDLYVRKLVFFWKLVNESPKFMDSAFCAFINLILLFSFCYYFGILPILVISLLLYYIIFYSCSILFIIINKHYAHRENKNFLISFFIANQLKNFLSFPIGTLMLYLFYNIIWFFIFFFGSIIDNRFNMFISYFLEFFKGTHEDLLDKWAQDDMYCNFMHKYYLSNKRKTYYRFKWGMKLFEDGLKKRVLRGDSSFNS